MTTHTHTHIATDPRMAPHGAATPGWRDASRWAAALAVATPLLLPTAHAQTPALTPATSQPAAQQPASAASAPRPERRHLTPDEKRESATAPGALRPTDQVVPQLRIPIGRNAGDSASAASNGGGAIDDDAARCRAKTSAADRARCGAGAQKVMAKPSLRP